MSPFIRTNSFDGRWQKGISSQFFGVRISPTLLIGVLEREIEEPVMYTIHQRSNITGIMQLSLSLFFSLVLLDHLFGLHVMRESG